MRYAAAVALCVAFAARADEQPLPVYPGTVHTRIGEDLVIAGEYYRLAYFLTADGPKKVAMYFAKAWKDEGYPVTVDGDFVTEGIVSAFYTREGLVRSVVVRRHEGKTLGFTVLKDLWVKAPGEGQPPPVPPLEGALFAQDARLRDDGGGSFSRTAMLPVGLADAIAQVKKGLEAKRFVLGRDTKVSIDKSSQRVLEFGRGTEQVLVTLVEVEPKVTAVQQTWVGSDRPDAVPNDQALQKRGPKK